MFEDYKKALNVLKEVLPKKLRDAQLETNKAKNAEDSLQELRKKLSDMDKEHAIQSGQLEMLKNL